jgi:hypothetical protein
MLLHGEYCHGLARNQYVMILWDLQCGHAAGRQDRAAMQRAFGPGRDRGHSQLVPPPTLRWHLLHPCAGVCGSIPTVVHCLPMLGRRGRHRDGGTLRLRLRLQHPAPSWLALAKARCQHNARAQFRAAMKQRTAPRCCFQRCGFVCGNMMLWGPAVPLRCSMMPPSVMHAAYKGGQRVCSGCCMPCFQKRNAYAA